MRKNKLIIFSFLFVLVTSIGYGKNELSKSIKSKMERNTARIYNIIEMENGKEIRLPTGSGFLTGDRYIVTNEHVAMSQKEVMQYLDIQARYASESEQLNIIMLKVLIEDGSAKCKTIVKFSQENRSYEGEIITQNVEKDIAILELDKSRNNFGVNLMKTEDVSKGMDVYAAGFPGSGDLGTEHSKQDLKITKGTINSITVDDFNNDGNTRKIYNVDAAITPGNSGGPLYNDMGYVIGINTSMSTDRKGGDIEGANYSVRIEELIPLLEKNNVAYKVGNKNLIYNIKTVWVYDRYIVFLFIAVALAFGIILFLYKNQNARESLLKTVRFEKMIDEKINQNKPKPQNDYEPVPSYKLEVKYKIKGLSGQYKGKTLEIKDGESLIMGRSKNNAELIFSSKYSKISGTHCRLKVRNGNLYIRDISSNGTYISKNKKFHKLGKGNEKQLRNEGKFCLVDKRNAFKIYKN